jgi:lipoprotein NlpI
MSVILVLAVCLQTFPQDVPSEAEIVRAIRVGKSTEAEAMATKRIAADDKAGGGYYLRALARDRADKLAGAMEDIEAALARKLTDDEKADTINLRGMVRFKNAQIKESIEDFDAYLKMKPAMEPHHWQRGISFYYAKRFDDGRKQFDDYQRVDGSDVENVVWRAMCISRKDGFAKARDSMAPVGFDRRVPMMTIYRLFKDEVKPADVLKQGQSKTADADEAKQRLFYAHLYIGLYSELKGDKALTKEHLKKAVEIYSPGPYMWSVARTHLKLLEQAKE